jgi:hypothetical protein
MGSLPKEARTKVEINELRVARGIVDSSSVDVEIDGRKPGEMPDILAQLERLPPDVEDKLTHVEGVEGRLLLLPEENLKKLREPLSLDGMSFNVPDAIPPAVVAAQEYAERLVRAHVRDFDAYPAETRAKWLIETIKRVNKVGKSIHALGEYLAFAAPGKSKTVMDAEELLRDVQAAILKDVYGLEYKEIREKLGMEPLSDEVRPGAKLSPSAWAEDKHDDATVRKMADRGREVLERDFGKEGWRTKAKKMRALWEGFNELEKRNR